MDIIYKKQRLALTRFWGDNRLCLRATEPEQKEMPKMQFVGGYPMNGTYLLMILQMKKKVRLQIFMATLLEYRNLIYKSQFWNLLQNEKLKLRR